MHVVVVGAGILGLLTAETLARAGVDVTVLEQGGLPAMNSTSWDQHRIVRALHPADSARTALAVQAEAAWAELASTFDRPVYHGVGALSALPPSVAQQASALLTTLGAPHRHLRTEQLRAAYPLLRWPDHLDAIYETRAGILRADEILTALTRRLARHASVTLRAHQQVTHLDAGALQVRTQTGARWAADGLVVTAGLGSGPLFPQVPGDERRQLLLYATPPALIRRAWQALPAIPATGDPAGAWLIPPVAGTALKLTSHEASWSASTTPDQAAVRAQLIRRFTALIPGFSAAWVQHERLCTYRVHPHESGPQLRALRPDGRAVAVTACGGGAFKLAPLIAAALTARILNRPPLPPPAAVPWTETVPQEFTYASLGH